MLTDFQNFVTDRLTGKFATNSYLNIPPHLKYVATLTTLLSENWRQSEICIVINDKSQHSTAKHLSCNGLLDYDFWFLPSVHWRCWLGSRKGIWPVKTEWWGAGVVICLERGADLHMAQLKPLPLTVSCFSKIQIGFTFLLLLHPGSPGQMAVKCVCVGVTWLQTYHSICCETIF